MFAMAGRVFGLLIFLMALTRPVIAQVQYVPNEILERTKVLAREFFDGEDFKGKFIENSFCFSSAESSYGLGEVTNCVVVFGPENFRVWLMDQKVQTLKQNAGVDQEITASNVIHNFIATVLVSTDGKKPVAYYLELDPDDFSAFGALQPVEYKVPCIMCHPSGPRLIRPHLKSLNEMTEVKKNQLRALNEEIAGYKIVENYFPNRLAKSKLLPAQYELNMKNTLTMKSCAECHNDKKGIRSKLTYVHKGTISYLGIHSAVEFGSPLMPAYDHAGLSTEEKACLRSWLNTGAQMKDIKECGKVPHMEDDKLFGLKRLAVNKAKKEVLNASPANDATRTFHSDLKAFVSTSLHNFEIEGLKLNGRLSKLRDDKNSKYLELFGSIMLQNLTSGISVRDRHIMRALNVEGVSTAEVKGRVELKAGQSKNQLRLYCNQRESFVDIETDCDSALKLCAISGVIELQQCQVDAPRFLGISVDSKVVLKGVVKSS